MSGTSPSPRTLRRLDFELVTDHGNSLRERSGTDAESAFYDPRLAADVLCEVEDRRLAFSWGTHHLKSYDRRVDGLQRLETPDWTDQLLQLAMIGLDDVVQILTCRCTVFAGHLPSAFSSEIAIP